MMVALGRHGLLGMISFWVFFEAIYEYPITFNTGSFYFPQSILTIIIILGLATYAFYISIAGQPIFGKNVLKRDWRLIKFAVLNKQGDYGCTAMTGSKVPKMF